PEPDSAPPTSAQKRSDLAAARAGNSAQAGHASSQATRPFFTEPPRDFADQRQREELDRAIESVRVPAVAVDATVEQAQAAVERAAAAFETWRQVDPAERSRVLLKAAAAMRQRRAELAAVIVREAGKTRIEADADVCE